MNDTVNRNGNLIGFLNLKKGKDDDRPAFQGKITLPGSPGERGFALWASTSKATGQILLTGKAGMDATAQIDSLARPEQTMDPDAAIRIAQSGGKDLTIDPHSMLLFSNKQKDAEHSDRPDYWGYYNPGGGERLMKLAVWARTDSRGNAMLTGNIQRDEPREQLKPAPAKAKSKTKSQEMSL